MIRTLKLGLLLSVLAAGLVGCSGGEDPATTNPGEAPSNKGAMNADGAPNPGEAAPKAAPTQAQPQGEGLAPK